MEVTGATSGSNVPIVDRDKTGFSGLTADSFMKLLITELQNQDPLEPMGNEQLLNQMSMMRNLQSNIELSDTLKSIATSQQLGTASGFIGKSIIGSDAGRNEVRGVVDRAFLADGKAYVGIGPRSVALEHISSVRST